MTEQIPVIDIADMDHPGTRAAIDEACREWGFFQAEAHGLDPERVAALFSAARDFFAQPAVAKQRVRRDADNPWGYFDQELTKNRQDWKEIYDLGPPDGGAQAQRWPAGDLRPRFEAALRAAHAEGTRLSLRLLSTVARNLGATPEALLRGFGPGHTSFLRLNRYPALPRPLGDTQRPYGVGEHTDAGALTVLLTDGRPGLEVCRGGRWHPVQPVPGAVIVNIGDIVQVWSNDRYRAALHRVVASPLHERFSAAFFLNPSYETRYAPLPSVVSPAHPAHYRAIGWREFRALRSAGDYADLGEEIQISHYRLHPGN